MPGAKNAVQALFCPCDEFREYTAFVTQQAHAVIVHLEAPGFLQGLKECRFSTHNCLRAGHTCCTEWSDLYTRFCLFQRTEEIVTTAAPFDTTVDFKADENAAVFRNSLVADRYWTPADSGEVSATTRYILLSHLPPLQRDKGNAREKQKKEPESNYCFHIIATRKRSIMKESDSEWSNKKSRADDSARL